MKQKIQTLKNSLSAVLKRVQAGEDAIVTSHRKPIAKIVSLAAEATVQLGGAGSTGKPAKKPVVPG